VVFVASFVLLVIVICLCLTCSFYYVWCMSMPLCLWCPIAIGFCGLLLFCFLFLPFMFEGLGNWFGKRKFDQAWGEMCGIKLVM